MIIALTGHRIKGFGHNVDVVRERVREILSKNEVEAVITGMANGFDLIGGDVALDLGINVHTYRPWAGHAPSPEDESVYNRLVRRAERNVIVDDSIDYSGSWMYHNRNKAMVDAATHVLAYLSPRTISGGTFNCVKYTHQVGKPVKNLWLK